MIAGWRSLNHDARVLISARNGSVNEPSFLLVHQHSRHKFIFIPVGESAEYSGRWQRKPERCFGQVLRRIVKGKDAFLLDHRPLDDRICFDFLDLEVGMGIPVVDSVNNLGIC